MSYLVQGKPGGLGVLAEYLFCDSLLHVSTAAGQVGGARRRLVGDASLHLQSAARLGGDASLNR